MGYDAYTYQKFPVDYIVGQYTTHVLSPTAIPPGGSLTVTGTIPDGLTANLVANTLSGYATTEGDYNIIVTVKDSGNITVITYYYTVVVFSISIETNATLPMSYTAYTNMLTIINNNEPPRFWAGYIGSFIPNDVTTIVWEDNGSILPMGVSLVIPPIGTLEYVYLDGASLEAGEFLLSLKFTDLDGHICTKKFVLEFTTASSVDSSFQTSLKTVTKVGATVGSVFTMPYMNIGGYAPSDNYHFTWTNYPSPIPVLPSSSNATMGVLTGSFTYTPSIYYDHYYRAIVNDAPIQKKVTKIQDRVVYNLTGNITYDGVNTTTPLVWLTTKDDPVSQTNELYSYNLNTNVVTAAAGNPYLYSINAISGPDFEAGSKTTSLYMITGPETSVSEFVMREISTTNLTQTSSTTFDVVNSGVVFNDIVRGTSVSKLLLLTNTKGCWIYDTGTGVASASSTLNVDRYYECGVSTINSGTEYFWVLNKTNTQLIKYNPSTDAITATYTLPSANLSKTGAKNGIFQSGNSYIYITDCGNSKVYIFNIGAASWTTKTFSASYTTPVAGFYDGNFVYILFQDTNNIYVGYPATLAAHYDINLHTDRRLVDITYSGGGTKEYDAIGPLRTGSVLIRQFTKDHGLVTLTDNGSGTLISDNTAAIPNTPDVAGTINYVTGVVTFVEYNQGESFPIDISYITLPTNMIGGRRRDTHRIDWVVNNPFITSGYSFYSYVDHTVKISMGLTFGKTSTDTISPAWIENQSVKESVGISGSIATPALYDNPILLDGTMPTGVSLDYPDLDNTYFAVAGPATSSGIYYFTVEIDDSVDEEYMYIVNDMHPPKGGT